jgi:hypothetical protein
MLRTGQLRCAPPRRRDLARRRGPRYRGPWRLPGPDSHRLAAVSLSLGYVVVPSLRWSSAPELLDAHSAGIAASSGPWRRCFPPRRLGATVLGMVNLGSVPGDPDEITVSTTDPDKVTVWLGAAGATDLSRRQAEELAALLLRAVRQFGG